ncbi:6167_t:CDS:2 [Paraglomus occultum]|uniref:Endocytosis protein 3 n=1 Tax=Paraglomus occultum TaxID=144539 RepID=A0A9N8WCY0_9GLOM|nr:6167_t:CDS:2 [Paraglomus occultum]
MSGMSNAEQQQYYQTFLALNPINGYIGGAQAREWLITSGLPIKALEQIWDLCDIDKDGRLDFDEFVVTYKLTKDLSSGLYSDIPQALPAHMIPQSKIHLLGGNFGGGQRSFSTSPSLFPQQTSSIPTGVGGLGYQTQQIAPPPVPQQSFGAFPTAPLTDDFDWYIPPADKFNYENLYSKRANIHGYVRFEFFEDLFQQLGLSPEECYGAWKMVDVNIEQQLGKDAALVFLHILNQRSKGRRIPNQMPKPLRTSLMRGKLDYNYNEALDSSSSKSRSSSGSTRMSGELELYNSSCAVDTLPKKEEEQLLKQIAELDEKIKTAEERALSNYTSAFSSNSTPKSEFTQLYEFKKRQLAALSNRDRQSGTLEDFIRRERSCLRELQDGMSQLKTQVTLLEALLDAGKADLRHLERDIESEKVG